MKYYKDLKSEHKDLFLKTRAFLLSFDGVLEERITTYSNKKGGICHMRTKLYGIDLGFLKGVKMKDKLALLTGKGKAMRVLPLTKLNKQAVKFYIEQAIAINSTK